jgi:hypothetical protein
MYKVKGWGPGGGDRYFSYYEDALHFCILLGINPKKIICTH